MIRYALPAAGLVAATPLAAASTTHASQFVEMAGASDLYEKTSSQMILKTAKDPKVRNFAQMKVDDHSKTTMQVTAAAKSDGLKPMPPKLMPEQSKMLADLKAAKPADRERVYISQQVMAHEQALALHSTFAKSGDKPALRKAARGAVPVVQGHLTDIRAIQGAPMTGR